MLWHWFFTVLSPNRDPLCQGRVAWASGRRATATLGITQGFKEIFIATLLGGPPTIVVIHGVMGTPYQWPYRLVTRVTPKPTWLGWKILRCFFQFYPCPTMWKWRFIQEPPLQNWGPTDFSWHHGQNDDMCQGQKSLFWGMVGPHLQ